MRHERECCRNCEGRSDKGLCEDILEPLRRDWGLTGIGPIHMPEDGYCKMFRESDQFKDEEAAVERDMDETTGKVPMPATQFDWEGHYGLR